MDDEEGEEGGEVDAPSPEPGEAEEEEGWSAREAQRAG